MLDNANAQGRGCRPTLLVPAWAMRWPLVLPISPFTHRQCWQTTRFPGLDTSVNSHTPGLLTYCCFIQPYLAAPADQQRACLVSILSHIAPSHRPKSPDASTSLRLLPTARGNRNKTTLARCPLSLWKEESSLHQIKIGSTPAIRFCFRKLGSSWLVTGTAQVCRVCRGPATLFRYESPSFRSF